MIDLRDISSVYMLGIGGIGMSALARHFKGQGFEVSGYDKTPSPLIDQLSQEGVSISFEESTTMIPDADLYVFTPAVPKSHPAFSFIEQKGGKWYKRSEVLEALTFQYFTVAIAGTHGKTTTTALTSFLWKETLNNVTAFIGGVLTNYDSNLISSENTSTIIAEADEYDRSFLRLDPQVGVITSLDPDHLDIYGSFEALKDDFRAFAQKTDQLIIHESLSTEFNHPQKLTYGWSADANYRIQNLEVDNGAFKFEVNGHSFKLHLAGKHNVENATAAIAVLMEKGVSPEAISTALEGFRGVKRRFEKVFEHPDLTIIDDYAHHPSEIDAAIEAARMLFPNKTISVVFQPHLFSRTRDFEAGFATSLSRADQLVLMPIYPAREEPIPGVSSANLLNRVTLKTKNHLQPAQVVNAVLSLSADVVLMLGAGDIDRLVPKIVAAAKEKYHVE